MVKPRSKNNRTLAMELPGSIKARLQLEAYRQGKHIKDIVTEILDKALPQFADVLSNQEQVADKENTDVNGKNGGTKTQPSLFSR